MPGKLTIKSTVLLKLCDTMEVCPKEARRRLRCIVDTIQRLMERSNGGVADLVSIQCAAGFPSKQVDALLYVLTEAGHIRYQRPADRRQEGWVLARK